MRKQISYIFWLLLFLLVGVFYFQESKAVDNEIVINEIAWMGTENSANDEWIELKNKSDFDIDLEGWRLVSIDGTPDILLSGVVKANSYFLLERTDDSSVEKMIADLIYTGSLGNTGEDLELRNLEGEVVDFVFMSEAWLAGDNDLKLTMEKIGDEWQNSLEVGGTPGRDNNKEVVIDGKEIEEVEVESEVEIVEDDVKESENKDVVKYKLGDILISEFVSDPEDDEEEWIELYNNTHELVNLDDWFIEEGGGSKTVLNGEVEHFFVIEKLKGNLNNKGDVIMLKNPDGEMIDKVVYGDWDGAGVVAPSDPFSIARKYSSQNTYNNANDFSVTSEKTKGNENIIVNIEEEALDDLNYENYDYNDDIIISEIYPNPVGEDSVKEFIELYNLGGVDIDLYRWRIGDNSNKEFIFKEEILLESGKFLLLYRDQTKIALNNNGDSLKLFQPLQEASLRKVEYKNAEVGMSYNYNEDLDSFEWSKIISPGFKNVIKTINYSPEVDFEAPEETKVGEPFDFDASDCSDANNDELSYLWDFGDGVISDKLSLQHVYWESGNFVITLVVSDGEFEIEKEKNVKVHSVLESFVDGDAVVEINRFVPNPEGNDMDGEWIELVNSGEIKVNLRNWKIDDRIGGSKPYEILEDVWLDPGEFFMVDREDSRIALNNTFDEVRLLNSEEDLVDTAEYKKAKEGYIFYKNGNDWVFEVDEVVSVASVESNVTGKARNENKAKVENYHFSSIEDVDILEAGSKVLVEGIVVTIPGHMSSRYFYIFNSLGLQIYSYSKSFPVDLALGDFVQIRGELSKIKEGDRVKISDESDIRILSKEEEKDPQLVAINQLKGGRFGEVVQVVGKVVEIKASSVFLSGDTGEIEIYLKEGSGVEKSSFKESEEWQVKGVLLGDDDELRLYPRNKDDILLVKGVDYAEKKVLGASIVEAGWSLEKRNKNKEYWTNLLILFSFVGVCLVVGIKFYKGRV